MDFFPQYATVKYNKESKIHTVVFYGDRRSEDLSVGNVISFFC